MTIQIRKGVFETNSSSTHSICIAKDAELSIPQTLDFKFGEFGWEKDTLRSTNEKASYLFTALCSMAMINELDAIIKYLQSEGIEVTCEDAEYFSYDSGDGVTRTSLSIDEGYVDHVSNLKEFLDAICADTNKLMRYLFSHLSFIITGNDNNDHDVSIHVAYEYDGYYKGN